MYVVGDQVTWPGNLSVSCIVSAISSCYTSLFAIRFSLPFVMPLVVFCSHLLLLFPFRRFLFFFLSLMPAFGRADDWSYRRHYKVRHFYIRRLALWNFFSLGNVFR